ncbi:MAG: response regulator, partial [Anaerolineae bacterium]
MSVILIVDDNEQNRYLLRVLLTASGYAVLEAVNGVEALALARRARPNLIISDILMPQMDGFALCRECKRDEQLRAIPFVFYTATYTDPRDEALALQLGAARFVIKPLENEEFIGMVREVLQAQAHGQ